MEIRSLLARHATVGKRSVALPGVTLVASDAPTSPMNGIFEPTVALVAQGRKRVMQGNQVFEYGAGQFLVLSVELPLVGQVIKASRKEPYLAMVLSLNRAAIAALLLETSSPSKDETPKGIAVSKASPNLLDALVRLLRLLDHPNDVAVLRPMIEREILWRLLAGSQGAMVSQIGLADSNLSQISRAVCWIRSHYAESFHIGDLARVEGMSSSSLHRHFRVVTNMSPLQFQKQIRLQEARARLVGDTKDVATVGFDVGYDSPSQFSREYRRHFGVSPGVDAKRLKKLSSP